MKAFLSKSLESVLRDSPYIPEIFVVVDDLLKTNVILEVGCCFEKKKLKYQPLIHDLIIDGYGTKLGGLIYGILGHVHRLCVGGLQIAGLSKKNLRQIYKCSLHIWRRRCHTHTHNTLVVNACRVSVLLCET